MDRVAIFRPVQLKDAQGRVIGDTWGEVARDVPCLFQIRPNVDDPNVFGRIQADNLFVLDVLHLDEFQEIGPDYVVLNQTTDTATGAPSINFGKWWRVRGPARNISQRGGRHAQKRSVFIYLLPEAPVELKNVLP